MKTSSLGALLGIVMTLGVGCANGAEPSAAGTGSMPGSFVPGPAASTGVLGGGGGASGQTAAVAGNIAAGTGGASIGAGGAVAGGAAAVTGGTGIFKSQIKNW